MKQTRLYQAAAFGLLLAVSISAAGCGKEPSEAAATPEPTVGSSSEAHPSPSAPSSASVDNTNLDKLAMAANNSVQQAGTDAATDPAGTTKPTTNFDVYSIDKPLLVGVAIGEAMDNAAELHGKPPSTFTMEDADDPLTVHEYDGFIIGYNGKKLVEFVEVVSEDIDPGLNGLRLGQTTADASKALGKPDSSTDYVLTYKTKETVLKLDLDMKSRTIQSIKLFARNE